MFEVSKKPYARIFKKKKQAWMLSSADLINFPQGSLGHYLGEFLSNNKFELIDKLESHDAFHVITGMSTAVRDEVGMQFLLLGNGKKSLYLFSTITICTVLLPEYFLHFIKCFRLGRRYKAIYKLDLKSELNNQLSDIRWKLRKPRPARIKLFGHLNDFI